MATDQIIAHVDLLRAVDRLLAEAEVVRGKRDALAESIRRDQPPTTADQEKEEQAAMPPRGRREASCNR